MFQVSEVVCRMRRAPDGGDLEFARPRSREEQLGIFNGNALIFPQNSKKSVICPTATITQQCYTKTDKEMTILHKFKFCCSLDDNVMISVVT